jgi:hypothetical protein
MSRVIRIKAGDIEVKAELNKTSTAAAMWDALPIKSKADLWGDEIYFPIALTLKPENQRELVDTGDLGYWPDGPAFCIFFGPTPISRSGEIRPASAVNVFGKISGNTDVLKRVKSGTRITISKES